jgi:hypothetical protein
MIRVLREPELFSRLASLEAKIADLRAKLAQYEAEKAKVELVIDAIRSFGSPMSEQGLDLPEQMPDRSPKVEAASKTEAHLVKPTGIPTTREMILSVVLEVNRTGAGPTTKEVIDSIREKWWPDAPSNRIRPPLWSLWREKGLLARRNERYYYIDPASIDTYETAVAETT